MAPGNRIINQGRKRKFFMFGGGVPLFFIRISVYLVGINAIAALELKNFDHSVNNLRKSKNDPEAVLPYRYDVQLDIPATPLSVTSPVLSSSPLTINGHNENSNGISSTASDLNVEKKGKNNSGGVTVLKNHKKKTKRKYSSDRKTQHRQHKAQNSKHRRIMQKTRGNNPQYSEKRDHLAHNKNDDHNFDHGHSNLNNSPKISNISNFVNNSTKLSDQLFVGTDNFANSSTDEIVRSKKDQELVIRENEGIIIYRHQYQSSIPCPPHHRIIHPRPKIRDCNCNTLGSSGRVCDRRTGQCSCHPNVTGRKCDKCRPGSWNITAGIGCLDCQCDFLGSHSNECHPWTGECDCKGGVVGRRCDQCQEGFYGFSNLGCRKCEPCPSEAFMCDADTGRCVCPRFSKGSDCRQCYPNTWGWSPKVGCQVCDCGTTGSIGQSCDSHTGQCICREGFRGRRCDECAPGYFGYPECRRCNCNVHGSVARGDGLIDCDFLGQCSCKNLVTGEKCDQCKPTTFGLSKSNPEGCTRCFCFGRSQECAQSDLSWGHIRLPGARNLSIHYIHTVTVPTREYEYVVVIQTEGTQTYQENTKIQVMNELNLVPSFTGNVSIGSYTAFNRPLYFQLPPQFSGDQTRSYGGFLRFNLMTEGCNTPLERHILQQYPLVQIHSHNKLILNYYQSDTFDSSLNETFVVPLRDPYWKYHFNGQDVNREVMMAALQNIKHIFLRGTAWADFTQVVLHNAHIDTAIFLEGTTNSIAHSIEQCSCTNRFSGYSCQDPGRGFYRWRNQSDTETIVLEDLVGRVVPCDCSSRSGECNSETGVCQSCANNTGGNHCERCAEGFYGDPDFGGCRTCPCPETSRNYARGCTFWQGEVSCICKPGYTGPLCEKCMKGYFGSPERIDGKCEPCDCNLDGIVSDECDEETGQCNCRAGITGLKCDRCEISRHVLEDRKCRLCDNCTLTLLEYLDTIVFKFNRGISHIDLSGVPPPWLKLQDYESQSGKFGHTLDDFMLARDGLNTFNENNIDELFSVATHTQIQWMRQQSMAENQHISADTIRRDAATFLKLARTFQDKIRNVILTLNNYGSHNHHANLPSAVHTAKYYLEQIKQHGASLDHLRKVWQRAFKDLKFYTETLDIVHDQLSELAKLSIDLSELNSRLSDGILLADKALAMSTAAEDTNEHNRNYIKEIQQQYADIRQLSLEIPLILNNSLVTRTDVNVEMALNGQDRIKTDIATIKDLRDILKDVLMEAEDDLRDIRKHWLPKAKRRTVDLMKRANEYMRRFQSTKDGARVALMASSAYKNISDAIEAARQAAIEAREGVLIAEDKLYPRNDESVIERGRKSVNKSKDLQKDAMQEMANIRDLKKSLQVHENKVDSIKSVIWQTGLKNNNLSATLASLDNEETIEKVLDTMKTATEISKQMKEESQKAKNMNKDINKLRQMFSNLEPNWDSKLGLAEENVSQTLSNIRLANKSLNVLEIHSLKNHEKFQAWNETISKQLQELRDKIAKARHTADGIKISVKSTAKGCARSYLPTTFGLSTSNIIKMTLALNTKRENSPLLFLQGENRKFIALEMIDRKIRLVWNLGGDTGILTHPLEIETRDLKYDDAWYHVEANRTLNIGSLLVRRMTNNGILKDSPLRTGVTDSEHTRFFRTTTNRVWLGGVPKDLRPKELEADAGLNVVIHQVYIDRKPLGLWNFVHSEGDCGGAMFGADQRSSTLNARHFNGEGYAEVKKSRPRPYRKNLFGLQMTFKTLDENALLFLAVDDKNNRSVSVTLNGGRIVFRIDYGDESKLEINTTKKYNTGTWVSIAAAREFAPKRGTENGSLKVNNEEPKNGSPTTPINASMLPDLSKAVYYLGGVPPGFRSGTSKAPGADNPFMGCMMDVQINGETYDPLESTTFFGVEQSCKDQITKAGFYGNGYVELPSQSLRKRANAGFVFRTLQPESLILLSAYPPSIYEDYDSKDVRANYSVSVIDGQIHVWIDNGHGPVRMMSNATVNDGEFHVINIIKTGRRVELMIDDELQVVKSLPGTPALVNMPKDAGGLYLGGAPDFPEYEGLAPTYMPFEGAIQDIVFNNRSLTFNEVRNFTNVHIGRSGPSMGSYNGLIDVLMKTEPIGKSFTASPEGCQRVGSYSYEPNAFKFGDGEHSHSQLNLNVRHFWQKNFNIKFDFRTFYPNGVILVAPGTKEKQKHFVALLLRDGHLLFIVRGRRREELKLTAKLNDGQWHQVAVNCQDRKVTMSVEIGTTGQNTSAQMKIPKKISASNMMFIGGIPENTLTLPSELVMKLEAFKGCIRKMSINNTTQDLARPGKHINVGQCFPRVEKGSYFPGDAYAVFKKNFQVGKYLELELEFRTSELNGVLLSVSEPVGFPALSLEVHDGNIIMSCDLGDGIPFRVQTNLESKFAFCDNKWHNISALYNFEQVTLRIDNNPPIESLAQHQIARKVNIKSPLYIGGLPDIAPSGTLLSRENFKGCIRNVSIRNERRDWIDMDGLHNVLLSECLAVN